MRNPVVVHVCLDNGAEAVYCNANLLVAQDALEPLIDCGDVAQTLAKSLGVSPIRLEHSTPVQYPINWAALYECLDIPLLTPALVSGRPIHATLRTRDGRLSVEFDARRWFRSSGGELETLGLSGWEDPAVLAKLVSFIAEHDIGVAGVLLHARSLAADPFSAGELQCVLNAAEARAWCAEFRASLWAQIVCRQEAIALVQDGESWSWQAPDGRTGNAYSETAGKAALYAVHCLKLLDTV